MSERVEGKQVDAYHCYLKEPHRPPSRGGNTRALHQHVLQFEGTKYSFLALGSQKWVFKTDLVSFEYEHNGPYRNIVKGSIETTDKHGRPVVRGNRDSKTQLRTAPSRLPASRREQHD